MGDRMTPIPYGELIKHILREKKTENSVFGVRKSYKADKMKTLQLFGEKLEMPFGPAAGPNTQLAQNIVASYYAGSRFFELKTVQKLDGEDLPVAKPCINAEDECYNVEWSTELYVPQAFDEYVKAWWACKLIALEYDLGEPDGFMFNMSVGYDLEGIISEKIDNFIEGLKCASATPVWKECKETTLSLLSEFEHVKQEDIEKFSPNICSSITLSTLHGCPPQEIERIASYLLEEKKLNTFVKCNPTLLGYEFTRKTLDAMGYDYIAFTDFHFKDDLQYEDAVPMLKRLIEKAEKCKLAFGVKLTNTFPVDIKAGELPGNEMYMSGKSLYPLTTELAARLSRTFEGKLRISYSGGADYYNIAKIFRTGIWPITVATTVLKPGGYERMVQLADELNRESFRPFSTVDVNGITNIASNAKCEENHTKAVKIIPSRKIKAKAPLLDCFMASCEQGCPIGQDIVAYMELVKEGRYYDALRVIMDKNPLPFITGTICAHNCMNKCSRNLYEAPVNIRSSKLKAAEQGYKALLDDIKVTEDGDSDREPIYKGNEKVAIIGGGPTGLAAAYFLSRAGIPVTIFEKQEMTGGVVRWAIPDFRIGNDRIDKDIRLIEKMGVDIQTGIEITELDSLKAKGYTRFIFAVGARTKGKLSLEQGNAINAIIFLEKFKAMPYSVNLGANVVVVGGGNTAMDTARAAKRVLGTNNVSLVYRRTKRYMPADAEELEMALCDGVEFRELLSPVKHENGILTCRVCVLGEPDASGRREPVETEQLVELPADSVIAAVGEKIDTEFYKNIPGLAFDARGRVVVDDKTLEAAKGEIYIAGDGLRGPATVVEGIRDARFATDAIINDILGENIASKDEMQNIRYLVDDTLDSRSIDSVAARHGCLRAAGTNNEEACLGCDKLCGNCVEVCPNRANMFVKVEGMSMLQVVHIDSMCNECGNCVAFCPYDSAPYRDKFTFFASVEDFDNSDNSGFAVLDDCSLLCKLRLDGKVFSAVFNESELVPEGVKALIGATIEKLQGLRR